MRVLSRIPLHPVLFAAYAVLFLYAANLALVLPVDVVPPLVRSVLAAGIAWAVLTVLFRDARRAAVVATAGVVAFFAFGHVAPGLTDRGLDELAAMPRLKWIQLGGCPNVSAAAVKKLQSKLPGTRVEKDDKEWSLHL